MEGTVINNRIFYLAGGDGSRFGANKLLYPVTVQGQCKPMYRHGLDQLLELIERVATYELYVVTCHVEIYEEIKSMEQAGASRVHAVYSPHSPFGISHTIRAGLEAASVRTGNSTALHGLRSSICDTSTEIFTSRSGVYDTFLVSDMPYIQVDELEDFMEQTIASGLVAGCVIQEGHLKNPVMFQASLESELLALTGDTGGKAVFLRHRGEAYTYEWRGCLRDIDYRADM